jgi:hypothetical protein
MMQDTNWDLIKFKYEFLGASLEDLAAEHSISLTVLQYNSKNWKQISLEQGSPVDLDSIKSIEDVLVMLSKQTVNQTQAFLIIKQKFLGPKFMELETILLHKAILLASNINDKDLRAASTLKSLTEVLVNLIGQNPLLKSGESLGGGDGEKVWEIRIVDVKENNTR